MATSITTDQLVDLVEVARKEADFPSFEKILTEEYYPTIDNWFQQNRRRKASGETIRQVVSLGDGGNAQWVGLFQGRDLSIQGKPDQVTANWRILRTHYAFDYYEDQWNSGEEDLADIIKIRRQDEMINKADEIEESAWTAPDSASDNLSLWGVPYWINMGPAGSYTDGFNASQVVRYAVSGTSSVVGGIDKSTEDKWRNWTGTYSGTVGKPLFQKMRKAFRETQFQGPSNLSEMSLGTGGMPKRLYVDGDRMDDIEAYLDSKQGSESNELVRVGGTPMFKRAPIFYIPQLNSASYAPIYGISNNDFFPFVQGDEFFREEPARKLDSHPTTVVVDMFSCMQLFCKNMRKNFVLHTEI